MAKQRHNQPPPEQASRAPLAMMAVGALLVAGLVVWALTRTVETPASVSSTIAPAVDTSATLVPPIDTTIQKVGPIDTVVSNTSEPTTTAGFTTTTSAPAPAPVVDGNKAEVPRIAAEDLREKVRAGTVFVIDTRDAAAFAAAHVPGAINLPMASVEANLDRIPKGKEIVTYCT